MSRLWAPQRIFKKVWSLSYLFSGIRISGQASRSCKIELVANNWPLAIGFLLLAEPTSSKEQMNSDQQQAASNYEPEASSKIPQIIGENNGGK